MPESRVAPSRFPAFFRQFSRLLFSVPTVLLSSPTVLLSSPTVSLSSPTVS